MYTGKDIIKALYADCLRYVKRNTVNVWVEVIEENNPDNTYIYF